MDPHLLQRTRYLLRNRARRVQKTSSSLFPSTCKQLLEWLNKHPIFKGLLHTLIEQEGYDLTPVRQVVSDRSSPYAQIPYSASSIDEHAAICWVIVQAVGGSVDLNDNERMHLYIRIYNYLQNDNDFVEIEKAIESIRDIAIDDLYEYLDEKLDSRNMIVSLLMKYKERCEWFHRNRLRDIAINGIEGKVGERALAVNLQEYVFDQQVDFVIEPVSSSGETDLILTDPDGRRLILDAKYIKSDASRTEITRKLRDGFHQLYRYANDFNESDGFLVVFVETNKRLVPELETTDGFRYLQIGGKTIYYVEVHISDEPSASRSGQATEVPISRASLISTVEEVSNESTN